jgi:hypothetical protein
MIKLIKLPGKPHKSFCPTGGSNDGNPFVQRNCPAESDKKEKLFP